MSIPNHIFDQLNSQADLVSLIGKHTTLKKAGHEYKGCCPFHGEKTPSFYVNPSKNMYHCFGCGAGGNALKFLQEYENLTFMEAVKELSQQTGIEIPEEDNHKIKYQRNVPPVPVQTQPVQVNDSGQKNDDDYNYNHHNNQKMASPHTISQPLTASEIFGVTFTDTDENDDHDHYQNHNHGYIDYGSQVAVAPVVDTEGNLYDLLQQIHQFYQQCLSNNMIAYHYFKQRGLTDETIQYFGLGYAPEGWQHLEARFPNDIEGLKLLGLIRTSEKGRDYNLLRNRVIFAIRDNQGRIIGFAGRTLDDEVKPKYINSSDSPVFHKQHVLYGYYESRQQRANDWLVVEGYMDVIALYQAGIYGAVASMGTAINESQVSRLLSLNPVLTLSFDGDGAGQKAAWRTLEISLPILTDDKELRFLTLPNNHDPDTYIKENGTEAMQSQISTATPLSHYVFNYLSQQHTLDAPEGKAKLMAQVRALTIQLPKGSIFRSLLNNDVYQKLTGRGKTFSNNQLQQQNVLLDFKTKLTLSINLCLCLLYQPSLLEQQPIEALWQQAGVLDISISNRAKSYLRDAQITIPTLPDWQDFERSNQSNSNDNSNDIVEFVSCIQCLLPHLPEDSNAASHVILASLPESLQIKLSSHWQAFYARLLKDNIIDVQSLFNELLVQQLVQCFQSQHKQAKNIYLKDLINKRRTKLISWQKSQTHS